MEINKDKEGVSIIIPTFNERKNIISLIDKIKYEFKDYFLEIIVVDDNSSDGTAITIKTLSREDNRIRLIPRFGRNGLSSAIKEGLIAAKYELGGVIDGDGQVDPHDLKKAICKLVKYSFDIVVGSRFLYKSKRSGLSPKREFASSAANYLCRLSLSKKYAHITDYQSICMGINLKTCIPFIYKIDVNGFKFFMN